MGKRSEFPKRPKDKYLTPKEAVIPGLPFWDNIKTFAEPCCGDGRLVRHLRQFGLTCVHQSDIEPEDMFIKRADALTIDIPECDAIITNPPWTRPILHAMIERFIEQAPEVWLLFDADWKYTTQRGTVKRLIDRCSHIIAIGRVKWIDGTKMTGKDNCAWYRFSKNHSGGPHFYPKA